MFDELETPALLLDTARLRANADRMRQHVASSGLELRPHLKTAKSIDVAKVAFGQDKGPIVVSTLREAEYFACGGFDDILYAVAIAPAKIPHVQRIQAETHASILLCVDSVDVAAAVAAATLEGDWALRCLIEIDCGEHRSGIQAEGPELGEIAGILGRHSGLLQGVMTHAGHSYATDDPAVVADIAEIERNSAVTAAVRLRRLGHECPIVSVGSTPTIMHARSLEGVTEARCGIYMFWDLAQYSRGMCELDDIAVSVLATVIGHNRSQGSIVLDAGALALSKDIGANAFMPDVKYGLVCDVTTLVPFDGLSVAVVHQEHGTVPIPDPSYFDRLPIGSKVRVLPNHACMTCAAYDAFNLLESDSGCRWPRLNGW